MITAVDLRARQTIEALRAGVPSRAAASELGTTQHFLEQQFRDSLEHVANGAGVHPVVLSASFGDGKSHLLRYLQAQAEKSGFATSFVVVSPEAPLGNAHAVLKAISEQCEAPGRTGKAVMELASNAPKDAAANLVIWAREAPIDDRIRALLRVYDATSSDEELRVKILGDFEGRPLLNSELKTELKRLGELSHFDLKGPRNALLAHDRIRLLAQFFRCHRAKGLVVFFDEVERIEKFSFKARLNAFQELGWWNRVCQEANTYIVAVFAETTGAIEQCLDEKGDAARVGSSNALLPEDRDQLALEGIALFRSVTRLVPATEDQLETLQHGVRDLYHRAFAVQPASITIQRPLTSVRSEVRRWITIWDLERHYPSYTPKVESDEITVDATPIEDDELANDDGDVESK